MLSEPDAWFTYYYWLEESKAPDFARTVDIHRKPGYDPVELFIDPKLTFPKAKIAWTLLKRKLGFRSLLDVIGTDADLVRGSHGLAPLSRESGPLVIAEPELLDSESIDATEIHRVMLTALAGGPNKTATGQSMVGPVAAS